MNIYRVNVPSLESLKSGDVYCYIVVAGTPLDALKSVLSRYPDFGKWDELQVSLMGRNRDEYGRGIAGFDVKS